MSEENSLKLALSKTDARFLLAVLILIAPILTTLWLVTVNQIDIAQTVLTVFAPIILLTWKWYFDSRKES